VTSLAVLLRAEAVEFGLDLILDATERFITVGQAR
jgi:hypothetical protein